MGGSYIEQNKYLGWQSHGNDIFHDLDKLFSRSCGIMIMKSFQKKFFLVAEIYKTYPSQKERDFSQNLEAISKHSKSSNN